MKESVQMGAKKNIVLTAAPKTSKASCDIQFRPDSDYKKNPNYGFDWIRIADTGYQGDILCSSIIGKYKDPKGNLLQIYNKGSFVKDLKEYTKLANTFEQIRILNRSDLYYVPKMTLWKGAEVTLALKFRIDVEPEKLEFDYNRTNFCISNYPKDQISVKSKGARTLLLKIKCNEVFHTNQNISILADGKVCGKLTIMANNYYYKANVVFVKVKTNVKSGGIGQVYQDEKDKLINIFKQAYVSASISSDVTLDLTGFFTSVWFKLWYSQKGEIDIEGLHKYLNGKMDGKYNDYYKIYVFGETSNGLNGVAEGLGNVKSALAFPGRKKSDPSLGSAVHEVLHAIGLYHTFDNNSKFTFEQDKIENIMDYSHWSGISRCSTTHWQWERIQQELSATKSKVV